jgi:hypothetical protein
MLLRISHCCIIFCQRSLLHCGLWSPRQLQTCCWCAGEDAYAKIRAGASLVELYTALAYEGPAVVPAIKQQLAECLQRDGFASVADAVGADHQQATGLRRSRSWGRGK